MAPDGGRLLKQSIRQVFDLAAESYVQKRRQDGNAMGRHDRQVIVELDLTRGDPSEPAGTVMVGRTGWVFVLVIGGAAVRRLMMVVAVGGTHHGERPVVFVLMIPVPAAAKQRMAEHRRGRQEGKDCFHGYGTLLPTIIATLGRSINPSYGKTGRLRKTGLLAQ